MLANPTRQLLPGMFVRVELKVGERPDAILIPQRAVVKVPNGHVAWVVGADNKVERRDLVVAGWNKDDWIVEKGLRAGDRVIVDGVQRVAAGDDRQADRPRRAAAPAAGGAGRRRSAASRRPPRRRPPRRRRHATPPKSK